MVYYLKYRPKKIEELDLLSVRERLSSILSGKHIPHAFLFSGPRGLGKTSSARILAKEVHGSKINDEVRKQIAQGSHPDVLEIDAASNRGVDEIRELRSRVGYSPMHLPKKVYIIDEVHMLTREAFNALLKTLEEPPDHVLFVLATTEPWKLPATIMSRVFQVEFERPTDEEIEASLLRIVEGEELVVEDGVLSQVAKLADGAFRDAAKLLEELAIAAKGKKITKQLVEKIFKSASTKRHVDELFEHMGKNDEKRSMEVVSRISSSGVDVQLVLREALSQIHVWLTSGESSFSSSQLLLLADIFTSAYQQVKVSPISVLPMQMAVVRWTLESGSQNTRQAMRAKSETVSDERNEKSAQVKDSKKKVGVVVSVESDFMKQLISFVDRENKMLAGVLRGVQLGNKSESKVEFVTKSSFHKEKIEERKSIELLSSLIEKIDGTQKKIIVTIEK